jgi:hypothetical protein
MKIFQHPNTAYGVELIIESGCFSAVPAINHLFSFAKGQIPNAILRPDFTPQEKLAGLLFVGGKNDRQAKEVFTCLKLKKKEQTTVLRLLDLHVTCPFPAIASDAHAWKTLILKHGISLVKSYAKISARLHFPTANHFQQWFDWFSQLVASMAITDAKSLAINGKDVLSFLGRPAGPWVKKAIDRLVQEVAIHQLPNERDILFEKLADWKERGELDD